MSERRTGVVFGTDAASMQSLWDRAVAGLGGNSRPVYGSEEPVLNEGGVYTGIWLECGPFEALTLLPFDPETARRSHEVFYALQRPDGQFPAYILEDRAGYGQIQQVVPVARSAWTLAQLTGDGEFLRRSYDAWSRWDAWLARWRDSRRLGLVEAFCEYDTGHDNSMRWHGVPKDCPQGEARNRPGAPGIPRIAPDLSATLYGGRVAMAEMAGALGRPREACRWRSRAEATRDALHRWCFDPELDFYFDRDADSRMIRIVGDAGLRVLGEGVADQATADRIFRRYVLNPECFWTPYPLPSIAASDPVFIRRAPENCWGGATQALAALRAPAWFERYGYFRELDQLMERWLEALTRTETFMQQMDPFTGVFSTSPGYSPAMCVAVDFLSRRHGILETPEGIWWGCVPCGAVSSFSCGAARLTRESGVTSLSLHGREFLRTAAVERILTDRQGRVLRRIALTAPPVPASGTASTPAMPAPGPG